MNMTLRAGALRSTATLLAGALTWAGCGLILGLDEFTDAPVGTAGGGGQGGVGGAGGAGGLGGSSSGLGGGDAIWSRIYGDAYEQGPASVAIDGSGNIFVSGQFHGTIQFGETTLISAGGFDIFLAKLDGAGNVLWSKQFGDAADSQSAYGLAVDTSGNVVLGGAFNGSIKFGTATFVSSGVGDAFVAKFDPSGAHLWSRHLSGPNLEQVSDLAIDLQTGDVVIVGSFDGTINFGNGTLSTTGLADWDVFIAKLASATGTATWRRDYGNNNHQGADAVAIDPAGNIIIGGSFEGLMTFGSTTLTNTTNTQDIFLARLDAGGNTSWAKKFDTNGYDRPRDIDRDTIGNIFMTGFSEASVNFGCGSLPHSGGRDGFLVRFDSAGHCTWSEPLNGPGDEESTAVAIDINGNAIATGTFTESIHIDKQTLSSQGHTDIMILKISSSGAHQWSKGIGDIGYDHATSMAIGPGSDGSDGIVFIGSTDGSLDYGNGPLTSAGADDIVLAKLAP